MINSYYIMLCMVILLMPVINIAFNYIVCYYRDPYGIDFENLNIFFYVIFYVIIVSIVIFLDIVSFRLIDLAITILIMSCLLLICIIKNKAILRYVSIIFMFPVVEEYLYRFLIYSSYIEEFRGNVTILILISSFSFSFLHYMQGKKDMIIKFFYQ